MAERNAAGSVPPYPAPRLEPELVLRIHLQNALGEPHHYRFLAPAGERMQRTLESSSIYITKIA